MIRFFQTFTVTIASPAVFTCTAHELNIGDIVILETTGALPTGLTADTEYAVIRRGVTADTFQLSTYANFDGDGTAINTSGTQSGTHTLLKVNREKITTKSRCFK